MKEETLKNVLDCMKIEDLNISEETFEKIKERILFLMKGLWNE